MAESRNLLASAVAIGVVCACHGSDGGGATTAVTVRGSGVIAEESRDVSGFTSVIHKTEGALYVEQVAGETLDVLVVFTVQAEDGALEVERQTLFTEQALEGALRVRAEDNLLPYLLTEVVGSTLWLRTKPGVELEPTRPIEFLVTTTTLAAVELQGIGSIEVTDLTTDAFSVACSGVGAITLARLNAARLDLDLRGVGDARASGSVDRQTVRLGGLCNYHGEDLQSTEADARVESAGSAWVRVSDALTATLTSSGSVYYIGTPTVEATVTGTGVVEQIGE